MHIRLVFLLVNKFCTAILLVNNLLVIRTYVNSDTQIIQKYRNSNIMELKKLLELMANQNCKYRKVKVPLTISFQLGIRSENILSNQLLWQIKNARNHLYNI